VRGARSGRSARSGRWARSGRCEALLAAASRGYHDAGPEEACFEDVGFEDLGAFDEDFDQPPFVADLGAPDCDVDVRVGFVDLVVCVVRGRDRGARVCWAW
jgi:hypothetical protein